MGLITLIHALIGGVWCLVCAARAQCQQGWRENEGTCYFFSSEEKTWHEAESNCLDRHGHLLSIRDIHEMVRVTATHPPRGVFVLFVWGTRLVVLTHVSFLPFIFLVKNKNQLWLRTQVGSEIYWIGLTDQIRENVWEWRDGSTYYEYLSYVPSQSSQRRSFSLPVLNK